jgi:DivIVA domain-containing protein
VVTFLTYLFGLVVVGGVLFLVASFVFGRGEELAPMPPDGTPVELPDDRPVRGEDVRVLRLPVVLRGYRMAEVDWVLDQLARQLDDRDREIARLRDGDGPEPAPVGPGPDADRPEPAADPDGG